MKASKQEGIGIIACLSLFLFNRRLYAFTIFLTLGSWLLIRNSYYFFFLTAFTLSALTLALSAFVESLFAEAPIDEESIFVESPALSVLLPLHDAIKNKIVIANKVILNEFFITLIFKP